MSKKEGSLLPGLMPTSGKFYKEGWGNALLVPEGMGSNLVGRMLTFIETLGLPTKQELAVKNIMRNQIYDSFDNSWIIGDEDHAMLREKAWNFGQTSLGGHLPPNYACGYLAGGGNVPQPVPITS